MKLQDYFHYLFSPFHSKPLMTLASVFASVLMFFDKYIGISIALFVIYSILAIADLGTGMYKNIVVNKHEYESNLFFKKLFVMAMMIISIAMITILTNEVANLRVPHEAVTVFNGTIAYAISLIKMFLIVAFLGYEISSIKENADELKWKTLSEVTGTLLLPLSWLKIRLQHKIEGNEDSGNK